VANSLRFLAPLIFSAVLSYLSGTGSGPYIRSQKLWLEATEQRLGFTASVISAMRGVKILGLVESIDLRIRNLRHTEVERAKKVRTWMAVFTLLQTLSLSGTRWITYTVFGMIALVSSSSSLNTNVLFTSLTILNIFMERLEIFLRNMPTIASSFGCLHRIETFLLQETKRDNRFGGNAELLAVISEISNGYELQDLGKQVFISQRSCNTVIGMKDLSIGWSKDQMVLQGINLEIPQGSVTMVIGT
jgi:ATP-binding cassette subfamily C (CFTR/MRP) protein 1